MRIGVLIESLVETTYKHDILKNISGYEPVCTAATKQGYHYCEYMSVVIKLIHSID